MQWNTIPTKLQRELFDTAGSMGDVLKSAALRAQIARFLHRHKDDERAPPTALPIQAWRKERRVAHKFNFGQVVEQPNAYWQNAAHPSVFKWQVCLIPGLHGTILDGAAPRPTAQVARSESFRAVSNGRRRATPGGHAAHAAAGNMECGCKGGERGGRLY